MCRRQRSAFREDLIYHEMTLDPWLKSVSDKDYNRYIKKRNLNGPKNGPSFLILCGNFCPYRSI